MKLLKRLFRRSNKPYEFIIHELDYDDSDAEVCFLGKGKLVYLVELEWADGVMDIEFGVSGSEIHNTTNQHDQYRILKTVSGITKLIADKITKTTGEVFHTITFKTSNWRNDDIDFESGRIRNRFFGRYIIREFPNAVLIPMDNNITLIKL